MEISSDGEAAALFSFHLIFTSRMPELGVPGLPLAPPIFGRSVTDYAHPLQITCNPVFFHFPASLSHSTGVYMYESGNCLDPRDQEKLVWVLHSTVSTLISSRDQ